MTPEQAKAQIELSKESAQTQRDMNQKVLDSQLDASDRIIMRKAADAAINIAETSATDPT